MNNKLKQGNYQGNIHYLNKILRSIVGIELVKYMLHSPMNIIYIIEWAKLLNMLQLGIEMDNTQIDTKNCHYYIPNIEIMQGRNKIYIFSDTNHTIHSHLYTCLLDNLKHIENDLYCFLKNKWYTDIPLVQNMYDSLKNKVNSFVFYNQDMCLLDTTLYKMNQSLNKKQVNIWYIC